MAYEPDNRYSRSRAERNEIDTPFAEQPANDRGHFWNIDQHIRGRWVGTGGSIGLFAALVYQWISGSVEQSFGPMVLHFAIWMGAGAVLGVVAASIWRRFTGKD